MILDGTGTGTLAKVNSVNRLQTNSVALADAEFAVLDERGFIANTIPMVLTSDNESAIYFIKNTTTDNLIISGGFLGIDFSTGGAGLGNIKSLANPTQGTLVDSGTAVPFHNRNLGSPAIFEPLSVSGGEGKTLTDGTVLTDIFLNQPGFPVLGFLSLVITPGSSFGVTVLPQPGNTSMAMNLGITIHIDGFND